MRSTFLHTKSRDDGTSWALLFLNLRKVAQCNTHIPTFQDGSSRNHLSHLYHYLSSFFSPSHAIHAFQNVRRTGVCDHKVSLLRHPRLCRSSLDVENVLASLGKSRLSSLSHQDKHGTLLAPALFSSSRLGPVFLACDHDWACAVLVSSLVDSSCSSKIRRSHCSKPPVRWTTYTTGC